MVTRKRLHGYCEIVAGVDFAKLVIQISETCAFAKDLAKIDSGISEKADQQQIAPMTGRPCIRNPLIEAGETPGKKGYPKRLLSGWLPVAASGCDNEIPGLRPPASVLHGLSGLWPPAFPAGALRP